MNRKFIPNGDRDFDTMADIFARTIAHEPARFAVSTDEAKQLSEAAATFRLRLRTSRSGSGRSQIATAEKEEARRAAEVIVRRIANAIRVNPDIKALDKQALGLRERTKRPKVLTVPNESPQLRFVRAIHGSSLVPEHELQFYSRSGKARPEGAVRLELFVDLIEPDAKVPEFPGQDYLSRPIYLRSFTRSPIRLAPPMAGRPMRVLYWARWADSAGNVGPFSGTVMGWVEGGSHHLMGTLNTTLGGSKRPMQIEMSERPADDAEQFEYESTVYVALIEAQRGPVATNPPLRALPAPMQREQRQLEGPHHPVERAA